MTPKNSAVPSATHTGSSTAVLDLTPDPVSAAPVGAAAAPARQVVPARCAPRRLPGGLTPNRTRSATQLPVRNERPYKAARARNALASYCLRDVAGRPDLSWSTLPELLEESVLAHAKDLALDGLQRRDVRVGASMAGHILQYWRPTSLDLVSDWVERTAGTSPEVVGTLGSTSIGQIVAWGNRLDPAAGVLLDLIHHTHLAGAALDPWTLAKVPSMLAAVPALLHGTPSLGVRVLAPLSNTGLHVLDGDRHALGGCGTCTYQVVSL